MHTLIPAKPTSMLIRKNARPRRFYLEKLEKHEEQYLIDKLFEYKRRLRKIMRVFAILTLCVPIVIAGLLYIAAEFDAERKGTEEENQMIRDNITLNTLLTFFVVGGIGSFVSTGFYFEYIRRLQGDLKQGQKVVEQAFISKKQFVPHNHSYFLHLHHPHTSLLKVEEHFYRQFEVGDEINLEYAPRTKIDFGYF